MLQYFLEGCHDHFDRLSIDRLKRLSWSRAPSPRESRNSVMPTCPDKAAEWSGVMPMALVASMGAPASRSSRVISELPACAATCRAVHPAVNGV